MKIISGNKKGAILKTKKGLSTRPLLARVKKSLFSILAEEINGAIFLDLFAGNGGVGIEALSRGADFCYFVDNDKICASIIYQNLKKLNYLDKGRILKNDFIKAIKILETKNIKFDLIFAGAPYDSSLAIESLEIISTSKILKQNSIVVIETRKNVLPTEKINFLTQFRSERYGDTLLTFYRISENLHS